MSQLKHSFERLEIGSNAQVSLFERGPAGGVPIARARGPECMVEPADVGEVGEPAVVDGVKGTWRVDPSQLGQPFSGRAALLSPFDRLLHDRKRTVELFEFDYQLEMHKPVAKRRWGYYALPILSGDRLVGKLNAMADRTVGVLKVHAIHEDVPFTKAVTTAVGHEIRDLAHCLGLELAWPGAGGTSATSAPFPSNRSLLPRWTFS